MIFVAARFVRGLFLNGLLVLLAMVLIPSLVHAGELKLAWDPNTETDLAGYRIHYGSASRNYDQVMDVGDNTSCTVSGLVEGRTYYFAATAVNREDIESDFSNEVRATISSANQAPVANAGPDQNVSEGVTVTLSGANSMDPQGGTLTYSWSQVSGTQVTLSRSSRVQTTFTAPNVGSNGETLGFELTVTDSSGLQSSDTCLVNVLSVNQPPLADAGSDQSVNQGARVTLDGSGSSDPERLALTYLWQQTGGSSVTLSSQYVARPTFTAPSAGQGGQSLTFQLTVTDSGGLQARDFCNVNVVSADQAPGASAGPDQTVNQGASVTLNGTGSDDPDGDTVTYSWLQTSGAPVTLSDSTAAQPRFTASTGGTSSTLVFRLTVTDPEGLTASDLCSVVVNGSTEISTLSTSHSSSRSGSGSRSSRSRYWRR
jgi:hypothetical protein